MQLFVSLDLFGAYLHWYVNHQKKVYTILGGILTSICLIVCTIISTIIFNNFIKREKPNVTENDQTNIEFKKIKFGEEKIFIPWTIADYHSNRVNFTGYLFPIIYYFYGERDQKTGTLPYSSKILNYTYCNETNLKSLNYIQDNYVDFNTLYCIDMDDLIMGGDWFHEFVYHIQMDFFLCEDGANMGTEGKKCIDYDELSKIIGGDNAWHIEIYYPEIQFKPKNKTEPLQIFYNTHFYNFNKLNTKVERFYFKEHIMIDDQGWIFEDEKQSKFWGLDKIDSDTYIRSSDGNDFITDFSSSKIYSFVIYVSRNSKIFTRKYTKILDELGNIMSIINAIFTIFKFFSQLFTEAYQDREIVANIFCQKYDMDEKFRRICESRKKVLKNLNSDNLISVFNQKNEQKKSNDKKFPTNHQSSDNVNNLYNSKIINKFRTDANNQKIKFPSKADKALEKIKNLKSSDVYSIKRDSGSNNLQVSKNYFFPLNSIDNSNFILNIPQKNLYPNAIKNKKNNLNKKKLIRRSYNIGVNNRPFLAIPKNFRFPYYLYLINIFNKYFSMTRMLCVNKNFKDVWKYMINIFDLTKYIQLQTNVELINKILFELKKDGEKDDIKRY